MKTRLSDLIPILLSAGILLAGTGLLGTFIPVRAGIEGFPPLLIGLFGSAFFAGFLTGCVLGARLIRRAGHIRVFAALAAVGAIAVLLHGLFLDPVVWLIARIAIGFCMAVQAMVIESWLNDQAYGAERGSILGIYRTVDLSFVTVAQLLLPAVGPHGFELFAVIGILFCAALIPVSLTRVRAPEPPANVSINLGRIWTISPLAAFGAVTIGMTNSAFRAVGPLYATTTGMNVSQVASFMIAGIVGGAIAPIPLGWLSDRFDRRWVMIITTGCAALAGLVLSYLTGATPELLYVGAFAFGATALPLWSLSVAHAADRSDPSEFVELSASLMLLFGIGAVIGPFASTLVLEVFGPAQFFNYTTVVHASVVAFAFYRIAQRAAPRAKRRFQIYTRTSPGIFRLGRKD